jgi:hypothetical protein
MIYIKVVILVILIAVLIVICKKQQYVYEQYKNNSNKYLIILTTAVNNFNQSENKYRQQLYTEQILKYLNNTKLHVYVVESTGYTFPDIKPNPRLHIYTFKLPKLGSSTLYEKQSLQYIISKLHETNDINYKNATHIMKITGRYYLDNLEYKLSKLKKSDMYLQKRHNKKIKFQNSEYYIIRKDIYNKFLSGINTKLMEHHLYDMRKKHKFKYLDQFNNNIRRGGSKDLLNPL